MTYSIAILKALLIAVLLSVGTISIACDKPYEGTYSLKNTIGDAVFGGVTATVGEKTFVVSSGASGTVEPTTGDKLIFSGNGFSGAFKIEGQNLINDKWTLIKTD